MRRSIFLILCLWCTLHAFAQSLTVTGVVLDNTGQTAIGATVVEEGTENGTITNLDGQFTLTVEKGSTLSISYVGFATQHVRVTSERQLKIVLEEDSEMLDEVVVVADRCNDEDKKKLHAAEVKFSDEIKSRYHQMQEERKRKYPVFRKSNTSQSNSSGKGRWVTINGNHVFIED